MDWKLRDVSSLESTNTWSHWQSRVKIGNTVTQVAWRSLNIQPLPGVKVSACDHSENFASVNFKFWRICFWRELTHWLTLTGFVVSKTKNIQRLSKIFLPIVKDFLKTLRATSCWKIAMYKHHFYQVISLAKSHRKMHFFVDICENLASINLFY
jgi:hypothetical protein